MVGPNATPLLLLKAKNNNHHFLFSFRPKNQLEVENSFKRKEKLKDLHINISFNVLACYTSKQKSFLYIFTSNLVDDLHHPPRFQSITTS